MEKLKRKAFSSLIREKTSLRAYCLRGVQFSRLDLGGYDFASLDLSAAIFKESNLTGTDFHQSLLPKSRFLKSNLQDANFETADCTGAEFIKSQLNGANFAGANLKNLSLYKVNAPQALLKEARLEDGELSHTNFQGCRAEAANFNKSNLSYSCLRDGDFRAAHFEEADCRGMRGERADFSGASLAGINLEGAILDGADFSGADLTRANLKFASLQDVRWDGAVLKEADLRYSRGIDLQTKKEVRRLGARAILVGSGFRERIKAAFNTPWGWAALAFLFLCLGLMAYLHFTALEHLSIPNLYKRLQAAKQEKKYEEALETNLILMKKGRERKNPGVTINRGLDAADLYRILGKRKESLETLESLLEYSQGDETETGKIKLELALYYQEAGDRERALALLDGVHFSALENNFALSLKLAQAYQDLQRYHEALSIYQKIIEKFSDNPQRLKRALNKLSRVYLKTGALKEAFQFYQGLLKKWQDSPALLENVQIQIKQFEKKRK